MKTRPAKERFESTFKNWPVPSEWRRELYRYVVMGYPPGSFHTAIFANDLMGAAHKSHVLNTWEAITQMCKWLQQMAPNGCYGSYAKVEAWLALSNDERRTICEKLGIIATEQEIMWETLQSSSDKIAFDFETDYPF